MKIQTLSVPSVRLKEVEWFLKSYSSKSGKEKGEG